MLVLIAESKTMASEAEISTSEYAANIPLEEAEADSIMKTFAGMSAAEISGITKLPLSLAARMRAYAYEFPNKTTGNRAIEAFTGVVFKALDFSSLPLTAKERCECDVRIVSSLYGWLRPSDIIKNYRLDYTSRLVTTGDGEVVASTFQKKKATIRLGQLLKEGKHNEILNLLPSDAAKCIDWKLIKNFAKVWKADFTDAATGRTPDAGRLKKMRGLLLRRMLEEGIENSDSLRHIVSDHFLCEGTLKYPDHLHFLC